MTRCPRVQRLALLLVFIGSICFLRAQDVTAQDGRWTADLKVLRQHQAPEWLLDAKLGIQFVGPPMELNDFEMFHWTRAAQRHRLLGSPPFDPDFRPHYEDIRDILNNGPYVWIQEPYDIEEAMEAYKKTGARYLVSMLRAAYPGTEGLLMTPEEAQVARDHGFHVGLHFNWLNRERRPMLGDPGYVEWMHQYVKEGVRAVDAEFISFDGPRATPEYLQSYELIAWFYNWADAEGHEVWVNDDLADQHEVNHDAGDVIEEEGFTTAGIPPRPWLSWDTVRNEWNCWVNEFGIHKKHGGEWTWRYKSAENLLQRFIADVSKGGGWMVQMVNTEKAWETMYEIGDWLEINGEAIYGTRPWGEPREKFQRVPASGGWGANPNSSVWWWRWQRVVEQVESEGPLYFTKRGSTLYAIHWGWPGESLLIPDVEAAEGASIRMLGADEELYWEQRPEGVFVRSPDNRPGKFAYAFAIPMAR